MAVKPVVRHMLLCDDWRVDPTNHHKVTIIGLLSNIQSVDDPPYPLWYQELCVFLMLTDGYGRGNASIVAEFEETGERIFQTPQRSISFGSDPLAVIGVPFRIRDCPFPFPGLYSIQFWYNDEMVHECALRLR